MRCLIAISDARVGRKAKINRTSRPHGAVSCVMLTVRKFALLITFCWFVGTTVHGEHGISLETDVEKVTVRNGSAVQLNCTITGRGNGTQLVADDLLWSLGHTLLTSNTQVLNNRTLQLSINSASWGDAGDHWCRLSTNHQIPGVNVLVIVGDIPSPPHIVRWENLELNLKLYWAAPRFDGGLPLKYSLKYNKCDDCLLYPCKEYSFENGLYSNVYSVTKYKRYTVWIEAQNSLGISRSKPVDIYLTMDFKTVHPCPPIVSLRGISRAIELHWKTDPGNECSWSTDQEMYFNISYRTKEDLYFKSQLKGPTAQKYLVLDGLKPYTLYYVYVSKQLEVDVHYHTLFSSVVGPLTARTNEEEPSEGPTNISCNAVAWPEEKGKMNVTLKWKPPPRNKWNGIIRSFRVIHEYQENIATISSYITVVNGSSRQLVLSGLNASLLYPFSVQACTINQDYCTSSLRQCTALSAAQDLSTQDDSRTNNRLMDQFILFMVGGVGGVLFLVAIFSIIYLLKKRREPLRRPSRPSLRALIGSVDVQQSDCPSSQSISDGEPEYCDI